MKTGSLVKIVDASESMTGLDKAVWGPIPSYGKSGIVLSEYEHRTSVSNLTWYTVLIEGKPTAFREDYLEVVSENR
jgi:hypothetical protein